MHQHGFAVLTIVMVRTVNHRKLARPCLILLCSPAAFVRWEETPEGREVRLNGVLLDRFGAGEPAGYTTVCKGRYRVEDQVFHALEQPTSLNTLKLLPRLAPTLAITSCGRSCC